MKSFIAAILVFMVACTSASGSGELTRPAAAKVIANDKTFQSCAQWKGCYDIQSGPWMGSLTGHGIEVDQAERLLFRNNPVEFWLYKEGYLWFKPTPTPDATGLWFSDFPFGLTDKAKDLDISGNPWRDPLTKRDHLLVLLARRKFLEVTGIAKLSMFGNNVAEVHFTWAYSLTPTAEKIFNHQPPPGYGLDRPRLKSDMRSPWSVITGVDPNEVHAGVAHFVLYDDGWRLKDISL
jgi:hypothetical protein